MLESSDEYVLNYDSANKSTIVAPNLSQIFSNSDPSECPITSCEVKKTGCFDSLPINTHIDSDFSSLGDLRI